MKKEVRTGKVVAEQGKFYLESEHERLELEAGMMLAETPLEELVGQKVEILLSEPKQYVVGLLPEKYQPILCYVPFRPTCYLPVDPEFLRGVEEAVRLNLAKQFLAEGLISEDIHAKLTGR